MKTGYFCATLFAILFSAKAYQSLDKDGYHPKFSPSHKSHLGNPSTFIDFINPPEDRIKTDWYELDQRRIQNAIQTMQRVIELNKPAKNVIFIMGDGMGVSTTSAARVYMAQSRNLTGEDSQLSWERMPHSALSKTYATDETVSDSASTATAMLCGEKTLNGIISCNQDSIEGNCNSTIGNEINSILQYSIDQGTKITQAKSYIYLCQGDKWTGVVTTARITHASPACTYAHAADRGWEADSDLTEEAKTNGCKDIAAQLIDDPRNQNIRVILGGGRENFIPVTQPDPEYPDENGIREDNRNLIQEWQDIKMASGLQEDEFAYVDNLLDFNDIDVNGTQYLMGLFEPSHMQYELDKKEDVFGEPTLVEMVDKAIKMLQNSEDGYFLFVESGRIDHAHHGTHAKKALHETMIMSDVVQLALDLTSEEDTLVVVSADHSHVFTIAGYPETHTDILSFDNSMVASDDKPYAILGYTNGPGYDFHRRDSETGAEIPRIDISGLDMTDKEFESDAGVPRSSETHGGEDVAIYARGPMAHLFHGTQEQSYIGNAMMYAFCVGRNQELCDSVPPICPSSS